MILTKKEHLIRELTQRMLNFVEEEEDWYDSGIWADQLKCIQ